MKRSGMSKKATVYRYSKTTRILSAVGASLLALFGALCIVVASIGMHMFSLINFVDPDTGFDPNATLPNDESEDDVMYDDPFDESLYNSSAAVSDIPLKGNTNSVRNILLLGVDSQTFSGRSDAMIVLSINDKAKTIRLISFQRDTWVTIPGRDRDGDGKDDIDKLAHAYAYGRFNLLSKTFEQNFRLDIDDYIGVNFKVLPVLIDAMGGLDISLTAKEMTQIPAKGCTVTASSKDPAFIPLSGSAGVHHLNGFQALEYSRIRAIDSDIKRAERQRKVISLLIEKAKNMSYTQLVGVVYEALSYVNTNMSADELLGFAADAVKYASYSVDMNYAVPEAGGYKGTYINNRSGLQISDLKKAVTGLHQHIYG